MSTIDTDKSVIRDSFKKPIGRFINEETGEAVITILNDYEELEDVKVIIKDTVVYKNGEPYARLLTTQKYNIVLPEAEFIKFQEKRETKHRINKIKQALKVAGVGLGIIIGTSIIARSCKKSDGPKGPIIYPTSTPTPTIEATVTPTVTEAPEVVDENVCTVRMSDYFVQPNDKIEVIVNTLYGDIIDSYNIGGEEKDRYKIVRKLTNAISEFNGLEDPNKIDIGDKLKVFAREELETDKRFIAFYERSTYKKLDDNTIEFTKNWQYDPSYDTTDGMQTEKRTGLVTGEHYSELTEDGYYKTDAAECIIDENFDLNKFVKETYTPAIISINDEANLKADLAHIEASIYKLNPNLFIGVEYMVGESIIVINPESITNEAYPFVLHEEPSGVEDGRIVYYVQRLIAAGALKGNSK